MIRLLTWLIFVVLLIGIVRCAQAAEPDVIQLDENCRLIRKAPVASVVKRRPFVVQFAKPPAPAASSPKKKPRRKPIFKADIPANYDLNCDETPPLLERFTAPPAEVVTPAPLPVPFGTLAVPPPEFVLEPLACDCEPTGAPIVFGSYPPPTGGYYPPLPSVPAVPEPVPAVPEPETWLLLIAGLAFYRKFAWRK